MAERVYIALDLETTGLDARRDSIIEIGAVCFQRGQIVDRFVTFVNPQRTIPLRVQQITHIRNEDVARAPTLDAVIPELLAFVRNEVVGIVAHNAAFDMGFLQSAGIDLHRPVYDTFELATMLLPKVSSYSLSELCRHLQIPLISAHRALADAEATAQLFMHLAERIETIPRPTLRLIAAQVRAEQTTSARKRTTRSWSPADLFIHALEQDLPTNVETTFPTLASDPHTVADSTEDERADIIASSVVSQRAIREDATQQQAIPTEQITAIFGEQGPLASELPDAFSVRPGQIEMATHVNRALNEGLHLLLEAGTGIGKSMAYLVPAALWSTANDRRVLIATNTITLQEQLLQNDIPLLQRTLQRAAQGRPRAALLKGRRHYLCVHRFVRWYSGHQLSPTELTFFVKILLWLPTTDDGDVEELFLAGPRERALWQEICSDPATCTPDRCGILPDTSAVAPHPPTISETTHAAAHETENADEWDVAPRIYSQTVPIEVIEHSDGTLQLWPLLDFYYHARRRAEDAHLLVVNHALLVADLVTGGHLLPPYSHLIVDEAHRFDEAATDQLTYRADWQWLIPLLQRLTREGSLFGMIERLATTKGHLSAIQQLHELADTTTVLIEQLQSFQERLRTFVQHQQGMRSDANYTQQLHLNQACRVQPQWSQIGIEWEEVGAFFQAAIARIHVLLERLTGYKWQQDWHAVSTLQNLRDSEEQLTEAFSQLNAIVFQDSSSNHDQIITWAELATANEYGSHSGTTAEQSVSLLAAPLYINEILEKDLVLQQRSVVFTGATLRTGSGFTYIRDRLGLWHATALTVESPFDYEWSTLLCMPSDMPQPNHAYYQSAVEQAIIDAVIATQGRTMVLFTSYAQLRTTADAIRTELDLAGITVLEHGSSSRGRLLREYRRLDKAVLLGTRSFWEGIDLPGTALQCLVIVKLPFAVPSDPLVAARCNDLDNAFGDYMLPNAILRFRQGFGRLIRREQDYGAVLLLDSRLWQKRYGSAFLESLPHCTTISPALSNLREEIELWLSEHE